MPVPVETIVPSTRDVNVAYTFEAQCRLDQVRYVQAEIAAQLADPGALGAPGARAAAQNTALYLQQAGSALETEIGLRSALDQAYKQADAPGGARQVQAAQQALSDHRRAQAFKGFYAHGNKVGNPCFACVPQMMKPKLWPKGGRRYYTAEQIAGLSRTGHDPQIGALINGALGTQVDYEFLSACEGFRTEGYVPSATSGVTIGTGFDLSSYSRDELVAMGVPDELVQKLEPYLDPRMKGDTAARALVAQPLSLTPYEANVIDLLGQTEATARAVDHWSELMPTSSDWQAAHADDIAAGRLPASPPAFTELTPAQQSLVLSRSFHCGNSLEDTKNDASREFYAAARQGDWDAAIRALQDYQLKTTRLGYSADTAELSSVYRNRFDREIFYYENGHVLTTKAEAGAMKQRWVYAPHAPAPPPPRNHAPTSGR